LSAVSTLLLSAESSGPTLWLELDVAAGSPCTAEGVAAAIRGLRPELALKIGKRPSAVELQAVLSERNGSLALTIQGWGAPLSRDLPAAPTSCTDASETAALIVDRYLDEVYSTGGEDLVAPVADRFRPSLALELGPSLTQMPLGLSPNPSPGLILVLDLQLGWLLFSTGGEVDLPGNKPIAAAAEGSYHAQPAVVWFAAGVDPRLGPGRLVFQASVGLSLLWVQLHSSLHQEQSKNATNLYVGGVAAYLLDLPAHFTLGLRFEERVVLDPSTFVVEGIPGATSVTVRQFTADLALLAGYRFF
jgi:hypothetical protein